MCKNNEVVAVVYCAWHCTVYCLQNVSVQIFFYFSLGEDVYASIDSWTSAAEIASILIQKR